MGETLHQDLENVGLDSENTPMSNSSVDDSIEVVNATGKAAIPLSGGDTVGDRKQNTSNKKIIQAVLGACGGSLLIGFNTSILNTCLGHISWELNWCSAAEGPSGCNSFVLYSAFLQTAVFVGAAWGSTNGGRHISIGRRKMLMNALACFGFGSIGCACSSSFITLLIFRIICGYGCGLASCIVPIYISEVSPSDLRGSLGVSHQLFVTIGLLIGTLLGLPINISDPVPKGIAATRAQQVVTNGPTKFSQWWWRVMLGFGLIPVLVCFSIFTFGLKMETPAYYLEQNDRSAASEALDRLGCCEDIDRELDNQSKLIQESNLAKENGMNLTVAMRNDEFRWVILFSAMLSAFQQLTGINVFCTASNKLFEEAGLSPMMSTVTSVLMNALNVVMTLPTIYLIEKLGRRMLMLIGLAGMTISVAPAAVLYLVLGAQSKVTMYSAIAGTLVFVTFFALTYGPILWVYLFEIFPEEIRGSAAGAATAVNWMSGIIMVFISQYLSNTMNFSVFTVMGIIAFILVMTGMRETKGCRLGESPFIRKKGVSV